MKLSHAALALALSSSLVLSACTDSNDTEGTDPVSSTTAADGTDATSATSGTGDNVNSTGDAAPTTGDAATATGDAVSTTGDAATATGDAASTDDGKITAPAEGAGIISAEEAEAVADELMMDAAQSQVQDIDKAKKLNKKAFAAAEFRAATAATDLREVGLKPVIDYHPHNVNVLAISRDDGQRRGYIVAQTVPESGVPELHLLTSQDSGETWRITWSAPMLPKTEVSEFDARSAGSPVIRKGKGDLDRAPEKTVEDLIELLAYPLVEDPPSMLTNGYAPQVRKAHRAQERAVASQATLTQDYELREGSLRPIEFADGSAMIFPVLERTSTFKVKDGMLLEPPAEFTYFTGDSSVSNRAEVDALVFTAIHVKADGTVAEVIAAREQVVGASGS